MVYSKAFLILTILTGCTVGLCHAADDGWYTEGNLEPEKRIKLLSSAVINFEIYLKSYSNIHLSFIRRFFYTTQDLLINFIVL